MKLLLLILFSIRLPSVSAASAEDCPPPPFSACIDVDNDWNALRLIMNQAQDGDSIVLCPFIVQAAYAPANPARRSSFFCAKENECIIRGSGHHVVVHDARAETLIWGFSFQKSDSTAVYVRENVRQRQKLCHCTFFDNRGPRGGALRTNENTHVLLKGCTFVDNAADRGGAIYGRGLIEITASTFGGNHADQGGAVAFASYASLKLQSNMFSEDNAALVGPVIYGELADHKLMHIYSDTGGNLVAGDTSCNGLLNRVNDIDTCHEFEVSDTPSLVPSDSRIPSQVIPTRFPSFDPTAFPTGVEPSASPVPSLKPSNAPTSPTYSPLPLYQPSSLPSNSHYPSVTLSQAPTSSYESPLDPFDETLPLVPRNQPPGYYNFNIDDRFFGPLAWHGINITANEYIRYASEGIRVHTNECGGTNQSPIDLGRINHQCEEIHQIRARGGDWRSLTRDGEIIFHITPSHLRIQFDSINPKAPRADSPGGFVPLYADHVEITTPSLHTILGRRFDAEYSIYHVQATKNRILIVSVLVDASENSYNHEFQKVLNAFSDVDDCENGRCLRLQDIVDEETDHDFASTKVNGTYERLLAENARISGKFNIYNIDMVPSIYWFAYTGSLPRVSWSVDTG
jgi:hypothetical protein